jgi:hypothetical protein
MATAKSAWFLRITIGMEPCCRWQGSHSTSTLCFGMIVAKKLSLTNALETLFLVASMATMLQFLPMDRQVRVKHTQWARATR